MLAIIDPLLVITALIICIAGLVRRSRLWMMGQKGDSTENIGNRIKDEKLQPEDIDQKVFEAALETHDMPDPELLIRTSGEYRISNYLLWQIAYSELYFSPKYWPDFRKDDLYEALIDYQGRERRFGKTSEQIKAD